jgi:hypothetical protein
MHEVVRAVTVMPLNAGLAVLIAVEDRDADGAVDALIGQRRG